jgi:aspartate/methionine/tyrosine aminotransferase
VLIPDEDIRSLADLAKSHNAFLIVDEIYLEFYFCKGVQTAFLLCDNIITTSSLTKAFGLGSLRVGWSFAPQEVVKKAEKMFDLMIGGTPCAMEYIIYKVLSSKILLNRFTEQAFGLIKNNLPLVEQFIDLQTDLQWIKPDGGIICFPRTTSAQKTEKLLRILSDEYQTWVIPGKFFFDPAGFRLGYGVESELLIKGLKNIDRALKKI